MNEQPTNLLGSRSTVRDAIRSPGWLAIFLAVSAALIADVAGAAAFAATCDLDLSQSGFQGDVCKVRGTDRWSLFFLSLAPAAVVLACGILARRREVATGFHLVWSSAVVLGIVLVAWSALTG